jgi:3-hydroxybutyryl-CoA dehydrogenase
MIQKIAVAGAGTMGSGIAMCAAQNKYKVTLFDVNEEVLNKAKTSIQKSLASLVDKNKLTFEASAEIYTNITFTREISDCVAPLIIEAIVEKLPPKIELFQQLHAINDDTTILASNTSSLSIQSFQQNTVHPSRLAGLHFFNPAQIMKLVEVVKGEQTSQATIDVLLNFCKTLNKEAVVCKDAPGFIVNRVARQYYLEAMKLVENQVATMEDVDTLMEASGFKMGPFKLMDLIGNDINLAVTESLYESFNKELRFQPSMLQVNKVKAGELGRKTNQGFYRYE